MRLRDSLLKTAVVLIMLILAGGGTASAQKLRLLAMDTFNGATNGALLGGATMALQNDNDLAPVRFGVGLGTLAGLGIGVYDMSQVSKGERYFISGTFNDGESTSIIVLLDSFYGTTAGALVGTAITLMTNERIEQGLQYGAGAGAWAGFGFGLIDAFYLSQPMNGLVSSRRFASRTASGLLAYQANSDLSLGFLTPRVYQTLKLESKLPGRRFSMGMDMIQLNLNF